jgi:hypothetical protein
LGTCLEHDFVIFLSDGIALCIHSLFLGYCRFFVHSALAFFWCRISVHMVIFGCHEVVSHAVSGMIMNICTKWMRMRRVGHR